MDSRTLLITPDTRVGELLDAYPELEEKLLAIAPAFVKLRNPVLRRTVAKVTTLRQAARVGNVSVATLVNTLREAVGQQEAVFEDDGEGAGDRAPAWLDESKIIERLDARPIIEAGEKPAGILMSRLDRLAEGEILELTVGFVPAPLIDLAVKKGFRVWHRRTGSAPDLVKAYFARATRQ